MNHDFDNDSDNYDDDRIRHNHNYYVDYYGEEEDENCDIDYQYDDDVNDYQDDENENDYIGYLFNYTSDTSVINSTPSDNPVDVDVHPDIPVSTNNHRIAVTYTYTIDDGNTVLSRRVVPRDANNESDSKFKELESVLEKSAFEGKITTKDFQKVFERFYPNGFKGSINIILKIFPFSNGIISHSSSDQIDESIDLECTFNLD